MNALGRAQRSPEILWFIQGGEETGSEFAHQVLPEQLRQARATLWLDENGYHDSDGTQRILARVIDDPRVAASDRPPESDESGALSSLVGGLARIAGRFQMSHRVDVRSLNKDFFARGCPWASHLPRGARYLAVGTNDPRSGIHAPNESVPMWTFPVHQAQLAHILGWVHDTASSEG